MAIVDELVAVLGYEVRGQDKLTGFNRSLDGVEQKLRSFAQAAARWGAVAAVAVGGMTAAFGRSVIQASAQFEAYQATLETIEGSADKAQKSLDWVADFAKVTPFELAEVTEAFVRLRAYGLDPMDGTLRAVGDAGSAMGKSIMQGVEAVADAATGEFERLKEFGIKSSVEGKKVTFTWSQNGKELKKTVQKNSEEITGFLRENFGARFNGAMGKQSKTFNGMMSNLTDSWEDFKRRVGRSRFFEAIKSQLQNVLDYIGKLDREGWIDVWAFKVGKRLSQAANFIIATFQRLAGHVNYLSDLAGRFKTTWEVIQAILIGLAIYFFPLTALFVGLGLAIDDFLTYLQGGESVIGDFIQWIKDMYAAAVEWRDNFNAMIDQALSFENIKASITGLVDWALAKLALLNPANWFNSDVAPSMGVVPVPSFTSQDPLGNFMGGAGVSDAEIKAENARANIEKMGAAIGAQAVVNDQRTDSRDQSVTVQVGPTTVQIAQPTSAPGAVGAAVGAAIGQAAAGQASRIEQGPAF